LVLILEMDDTNLVKDHMIALDDFVQQSILDMDNLNPNTQTALTDLTEQVQNLKEEDDRCLKG